MKRFFLFCLAVLFAAAAAAQHTKTAAQAIDDEYAADYTVDGIRSSPPFGINGHRWIVGENPSGAFAEHESQLALYTTGTGFTFETPPIGAVAFSLDLREEYVFTGVAEAFEGLWSGSKWKETTPTMAKWGFDTGNNNYAVVAQDHGTFFSFSPNAAGQLVTLPTGASVSGMRITVEKRANSAGDMTIIVSGGSLIRLPDGSAVALIVVPAASYALFELTAGKANVTANLWYAK